MDVYAQNVHEADHFLHLYDKVAIILYEAMSTTVPRYLQWMKALKFRKFQICNDRRITICAQYVHYKMFLLSLYAT